MKLNAANKKRAPDKRVFEISARVRSESGPSHRVLAISADSTILDLYLAVLGAFEWRGDYLSAERDYSVSIGECVYERGRGSRTPLRRVLDIGTVVECSAPDLSIACEVTKSCEVASRRHYPKVLDAGGSEHDARVATWKAQSAMHRELRETGRAPLIHAAPVSRELLEARLHGFFASIVSGPLVMPSEWLSYVINLHAIPHSAAAKETVAPIMELYNAVARQLHEDQDAFLAAVEAFQNLSEGEGLIEWSRGYFSGSELRREEWERFTRDKDIRELFVPLALMHFDIGENPDKRAWLRDAKFRGNCAKAMAIAAIEVREAWRRQLFPQPQPVRRSQPKISPNEACPCGSGKKYKRCCGSPLRVVPDTHL